MQSLNLNKGQVLNLTKESGITKKVRVGLGWVGKRGTVDLDSYVGLPLTSGHARIVYFSNLQEQGINHHGDDLVGGGAATDPNEVIDIDLNNQASDVERLEIGVGIWSGAGGMKEVTNAFINVVDVDSGKELCRYNMEDEFSKDKGVLAGVFEKNVDGEWLFIAKGAGLSMNMSNIRDEYRNMRPGTSSEAVQGGKKRSFFSKLFNM